LSNIPVKISALGTYVPPRILSNYDLEKMVDTNHDWIMERTGIRERHLVDKGVATSHLATEAAKKALAMRVMEASELDAIIVATVTTDMMFQAKACLVQDRLAAKKTW
jgi:3-oxoacyl-[acyl-carrier-protein] synthase-3